MSVKPVPKPVQVPTIAMVKKGVPSVGSAEWMEKIARKHGKTSPERLEYRRKGVTVYMGVVEESLKQVQLAKKTYEATAEKFEHEITKRLETINEELKKNQNDPALKTEKSTLEHQQKQLVNAYRLQVSAFDVNAANITGQLAVVESLCLIIDMLSMRFTGRGKKKEGDYRVSAARYLDGIHGMMLAMLNAMANSEDDEEEEEEEIDDEEIVTEDEHKKIEAEKKAKLKEGAA